MLWLTARAMYLLYYYQFRVSLENRSGNGKRNWSCFRVGVGQSLEMDAFLFAYCSLLKEGCYRCCGASKFESCPSTESHGGGRVSRASNLALCRALTCSVPFDQVRKVPARQKTPRDTFMSHPSRLTTRQALQPWAIAGSGIETHATASMSPRTGRWTRLSSTCERPTALLQGNQSIRQH